METLVGRRLTFGMVALFVVALGAGLALALRGGATLNPIVRGIGLVGIANGLFLLLSNNLIKRTVAPPTLQQIDAERVLRMRLRCLGAGSVLMGVSLLIPHTWTSAALMLCSAVVNVAAALRLPRRMFGLTPH